METKRENKPVFFQMINQNNERKRISINKKGNIIKGLARKQYLIIEGEILDENTAAEVWTQQPYEQNTYRREIL